SRHEVEPMSYYGVMRGLKEFSGRRNGLGVLTTVAARQLDGPPVHDEFDRTAVTGVMDGWHFLDHGQTWVLSGWVAGTYVDGSVARIMALQKGSRHYLQRPDARSYHLDSTATSLSGNGARLWLNKEKGNWFSNSAIGYLSPGL